MSGDAGGTDRGQVWGYFLKQIKEFGLYPEGNGEAARGFKQPSVTIIFSLCTIPLASIWSKD